MIRFRQLRNPVGVWEAGLSLVVELEGAALQRLEILRQPEDTSNKAVITAHKVLMANIKPRICKSHASHFGEWTGVLSTS